MPKPTYRELSKKAARLEEENRRLNQNADRFSEKYRVYHDLIASLNCIIVRIDPQGNVNYINKFAQNIFGYTNKNILGKPFVGTIVPKTEPFGRDLAERLKDSGHQPKNYLDSENEYMRKNGKKVWIAWTCRKIQDETGNLSEILCIGNDITKCKKAEEALTEKEVQLRSVIESLPFDFFALDETGHYMMQNSTCREHWGNLIGKRPEDLKIDKDTLALWLSNNRRAFAGEVVQAEVALQPRGKEGYYHNIISPIHDGESIRGILGVNIDITKRKRAEQALRESEKKFRNLTEKSPNMIFINKKGRVVYCNRNCEELMGYTNEEFCSLDFDFFTLISPESKETVKAAFEKHLHGKEVEPYEYGLITKDGRKLNAIITTKLIEYDGDKAILGIVTNITQRKEMENKLRESETKFRTLAESAPAAIMIVAGEAFLYVNPAFEQITGFAQKEALAMQFWEVVHPDMREMVKNRGLARQRGATVPDRYELKILTEDGQTKWIDLVAASINYGGQSATLATAYDISDRKQAEDVLLEHKNELENKTSELEEMNTALKILLKKREIDKKEIEESMAYNLKELVEPMVVKLQNAGLKGHQKLLVDVIESNLKEITSPISLSLASKCAYLTHREIQIANLIKHGRTSKEIAVSLGISHHTVDTHRRTLRKKLGQKNAKKSLRSHLITLEN